MKFTAASIVALCASLAAAQTVADLPQCSIVCFSNAISSSGCSLTDTVCQCTTGKQKITDSVTPCVVKSCSNDDALKVQSVSNAICAAAVSSSGGSSMAASTSMAASSMMSSMASSAAASGSSTRASSMMSGSMTTSGAAASASSAASSAASAATSRASSAASSAPAQQTTNAAAGWAPNAYGAGAAVLGVAAMML